MELPAHNDEGPSAYGGDQVHEKGMQPSLVGGIVTDVGADLHYCDHRYNNFSLTCIATADAVAGPKVNTVEKLGELRKAGVNVVRMNFSHGSYEYHQSVIDNTRKMVACMLCYFV